MRMFVARGCPRRKAKDFKRRVATNRLVLRPELLTRVEQQFLQELFARKVP